MFICQCLWSSRASQTSVISLSKYLSHISFLHVLPCSRTAKRSLLLAGMIHCYHFPFPGSPKVSLVRHARSGRQGWKDQRTYIDLCRPTIYGMSMEVQVRPLTHLGVYKYLLKKFATWLYLYR